MSEGIEAFFQSSPWAPLAIAFAVGLMCGWLVWGLRAADATSVDAPGEAIAEGDERKEIVVLRAELEAARALLDERDDQHEELSRQLATVDEALKRANGRLKMVQRGVKR